MRGYYYGKKQLKKLEKREKKEGPKIEAKEQQFIGKRMQQARGEREQAFQRGRTRGEEFIGRNIAGLTPEQKSAMESEADIGINRGIQRASRALLGEQARRGIVGKGGVGAAQIRDLHRQGMEMRGQAQRDIQRLDADTALKKLAAVLNFEQGEATQDALERQRAQDELRYKDDQRKLRAMMAQYGKSFSRI